MSSGVSNVSYVAGSLINGYVNGYVCIKLANHNIAVRVTLASYVATS